MLVKKCWGIIVQRMAERGSDGANGYILARSHEVADKIVFLFFFSKSEKIWRQNRWIYFFIQMQMQSVGKEGKNELSSYIYEESFISGKY